MAVASLLLGAVWTELWIWLAGVLAGAVVATLLPRLATAPRNARSSAVEWVPLRWRRLALAVHGAVIIREVWRRKQPGTCRAVLAACASWLRGHGFQLVFPTQMLAAKTMDEVEVEEVEVLVVAAPSEILPSVPEEAPVTVDSWYVGEKDLAFFQYHAEQDGPLEGATHWHLMMEKDITNVVHYTAWRRTLPCGKTEYKSVTLCPNATAQEFCDLYFDDDFRTNWDEMVIHHSVLEQGDFSQRQQVVRWIRRFPFAFLSDREYAIARRSYRVGDTFYGLTKAIEHPRSPPSSKVVHMDVFHSMWSSRDCPCPWGSGRPACRTVLLHHEQFKIPEHLARLAVRVGMWGFVKKMAEEVPKFIAARRARAAPDAVDDHAYGAGVAANPPMRRVVTGITDSSCTLSSLASSAEDAEALAEQPLQDAEAMDAQHRATLGSQGAYVPRGGAIGRVRGVAVLALVAAVAVVVRQQGKGGGPKGRPAAGSRRRHRSSALAGLE